MTDPSSIEERERIKKLLENTDLGQRARAYSEKWDKDQELRRVAIEQRENQSVFEQDNSSTGVTTSQGVTPPQGENQITSQGGSRTASQGGTDQTQNNPVGYITSSGGNLMEKDPDFPSLYMDQVKRIEALLNIGLSIRSTYKVCLVDNIKASYELIRRIKKRINQPTLVTQVASESDDNN